MSPVKQLCASWSSAGSLPSPVGGFVACGIPPPGRLLAVVSSVLLEVSSLDEEDDDDEDEVRDEDEDDVEVADEVLATTGSSFLSLLSSRISATAMPARTTTPAATSAMIVPLLFFGGCWPY